MALASGEGELPAAGPSLQTLLSLTAGGLHVLPVLISVVGLAYFAGAVKLWRSGRRWSVWATTSFMAGCALVLAVTVSGVEVYGSRIFSIFMFQQLTLMMAAPVLLVLGRPGTLLLKALPRRGRAAVLGRPVLAAALWGLRSRLGRVLLHPVVCLPLFLACFYGMYLTDLAGVLLSSPAGHTAAAGAVSAAGVLFTVPVLSNDPLPAVHAPMTQAAEVLLEAFLHAFFGVIIMMASTPLVPHFADPPPGWGVDVMADQAVAGGLAWSYGEIPSVLLLVVIFVRWRRSDEAAASARDRYVEEHGDAELEAYNAHLAALAAGSPARHDADGRTTPDPSSRSGSETGSETGSATGPGTGS